MDDPIEVPQDVIIQQPKSTINLESKAPWKTISDTDPRPSRRLPTRKSSLSTTFWND